MKKFFERGVASCAALLATSIPASSTEQIVPPEVAQHVRVVSLGDSIAAGSGGSPDYSDAVGQWGADPHGSCQRSVQSYAGQLATEYGFDITMAACRGAQIADIYRPQHDNPPQLEALTPDTDIVLLSVGANEFNLNELFSACRHGECWPGAETVIDAYQRLNAAEYHDKLHTLYLDIIEKAPRAHLLVVGYTKPIEIHPLCPAITGDRYTDIFADGYISAVNTAIRQVVIELDNPRISYVEPPDNRDICATLGTGVILSGENIGHPTVWTHREIARKVMGVISIKISTSPISSVSTSVFWGKSR